MAYIIDGDRPLIFTANPRTGSTAVANALKTMGAQITGGSHHSQPLYVPPSAIVFQVVRNHFEVINSFWFKSKPTGNFESFIGLVTSGGYEYVRVPKMYWRPVTHTVKYTDIDSGFKWVCNMAGLEPVEMSRTPTRTNVTADEMFSKAMHDKVHEIYRDEILYFGL